MKRNGKLSLALHALGHMALAEGPLTSETIARHNATNPVVVRRVFGRLREAGLLSSAKGHAGGWTLARPAGEITVAEVYLAVGEGLAVAEAGPAPGCPIEARMLTEMTAALAEAERALVARLGGITIADLGAEMATPRKA